MKVKIGFCKRLWNLIETICKFTLCKVLRLKLSDKQFQNIMQFIKFGIVGLSNTVISYIIYLIVLLFLQKYNIFIRIDYILSQIVAFILSVLWSFYWNNQFVFTKKDNEKRVWWKALIKTYVSYAFTGLFLNTVFSIIWVDIIGISKLIAPIINLLFSVPINFIMNKFWAFKNERKKA